MSLDILDRLADVRAKKQSVFLTASGVPVCFEARVVDATDSEIILENTVTPEYIHQVMGSASFTLQFDMMQIKASSLGTNGVNLLLPIESDGPIPESRSMQRSVTTDLDLNCAILNPIDQTTLLKKKVLDISTRGMSIRTPFESRLMVPGQTFDSIKVNLGTKEVVQTGGQVVYLRRLIDRNANALMQAGIKFSREIPAPDQLLPQS